MPEDPKTVHISNIDELKSVYHPCPNQQTITNLQIDQGRTEESLIHFSTCMEELTAQLQEQNKSLHAFVESSNERLRLLEISAGHHKCTKDSALIDLTARVTNIELILANFKGESKWVDRVMNLVQAVVVGLILALVIWFMKGGAIT